MRATELAAAAALAARLPALESVAWSTWFAGKEPGDDGESQTTTVWVARDGEAVAVRRAPW